MPSDSHVPSVMVTMSHKNGEENTDDDEVLRRCRNCKKPFVLSDLGEMMTKDGKILVCKDVCYKYLKEKKSSRQLTAGLCLSFTYVRICVKCLHVSF